MNGGQSQEDSNGLLKLFYFDGRGVADLSRIIFKFNHIDFIDPVPDPYNKIIRFYISVEESPLMKVFYTIKQLKNDHHNCF